MILLSKLLEQIVHQRRVDGPRAHGVDTDVLRAKVYGETSGDLSQRTFGQPVAETMRLTNEPLVRSVDNHRMMCGTASRSVFTVP